MDSPLLLGACRHENGGPAIAAVDRRVFATALGYILLIVVALAGFVLIRAYGETLQASNPPAREVADVHSAHPNMLLRVLIALAVVIVTGQILARLFAFLRQPPVIGEVVAGILLGPSLLGAELSAFILPPAVAPILSIIAQLGVILYMFLVGLELNAGLLRSRAHAVVATSHASIVAPFLLGAALSLWLYPLLATSDVSFTSFALFMGVAMSITAFPVLARILTDRNLHRTELGIIALSCAATDDVTAWCLLAFVVGVARAQVSSALWVAVGTILFVLFMFLAVRPIMSQVAARWREEPLPRATVVLIFVALLVSAASTELIGIHAIFGAFLFGAMIPHDSTIARVFTRQLEQVVTILLLPAFFALTGMRTQIGLLATAEQWLICLAIIAVATIGKFGGTLLAARLTGLPWRQAAILGTLMNTRGLMELIVLNIGLELGVIAPQLFAMMVLMALATTMTTAPVLHLLDKSNS